MADHHQPPLSSGHSSKEHPHISQPAQSTPENQDLSHYSGRTDKCKELKKSENRKQAPPRGLVALLFFLLNFLHATCSLQPVVQGPSEK